jgi:polysaccharide biosynthesis protein PslH
MRILFITPYPPSQIRIRSYGFLAHLRREHEVTILVQVSSRKELGEAEALHQQGYEVITVQESAAWSMLRSSRALIQSLPLQAAYSCSARFLHKAQKLCAQCNFDVIHVEHLRGIASMKEIAQSSPLVWDSVDCISLLCEKAASKGPSFPVRALAALEFKRTQRFEAQMLRQIPYVVTISEGDRQALLDLYRLQNGYAEDSNEDLAINIDVVPSGVDLEYYRPSQEERLPYNIVFFGKMSYHANVAAALYLYQQIMPLIWQQQPEATLTIAGSNPPKSLQHLSKDARVQVTGHVDDIRPYIWHAQVMVSPMVYSVGLQNKVIQAMALGTPTVVSASSAAVLQAQHGRDLFVASTPQEFAESTLHLLHDPELHTAMSQSGRTYVELHHNWQTMTARLVAVYQQAIASYASKASFNHVQQLAPFIP